MALAAANNTWTSLTIYGGCLRIDRRPTFLLIHIYGLFR